MNSPNAPEIVYCKLLSIHVKETFVTLFILFFFLPLRFPQVNNCILLIFPRTSLPPLSFSNKRVQLHFLSSYYVPGIMLGAVDLEETMYYSSLYPQLLISCLVQSMRKRIWGKNILGRVKNVCKGPEVEGTSALRRSCRKANQAAAQIMRL